MSTVQLTVCNGFSEREPLKRFAPKAIARYHRAKATVLMKTRREMQDFLCVAIENNLQIRG